MLPLAIGTYGDFAVMTAEWRVKHEGTFDSDLADHAASVLLGKSRLAVE